MAYDFETALSRIEVSRETARKGNYRPTVRLITTFLEEATDANVPGELARGYIHFAILRMHQHERSFKPNAAFLAQYFACIEAGLELCDQANLPNDIRYQLERRKGDYYYEVGNHAESLRWYQAALKHYEPAANASEILAPLGRALALTGDRHQALKLLSKALESTNRNKHHFKQWRWMIIKAGVLMKYAEAEHAPNRSLSPRAEKLMREAKELVEALDRLGHKQRLIQWRRLNRKLGNLVVDTR